MKKLYLICLPFLAVFFVSLFLLHSLKAHAFNANNLIDDGVFDNTGTMNAAQIDAWINQFQSSCIRSLNGFAAPDPTGYSPSTGFTYGPDATAGKVIYDAAQAYGLNPDVLLVTLQKEESLVTGDAGCSTLQYASATGYGCPDGGTTYNYSGFELYSINGNAVTSVNGTCVNSSSSVGFSRQVIHSSWLLKFGEQRSEGNTGWDVQKPGWDNSDDPQTCYGGPMTQGTFKRCSTDANPVYYDGYITIDGQSTHMDTGATAALYWYTPHFSGNQNFDTLFTQWFGSLYVPQYSWQLLSQYAYTDASKTTQVNLANLHTGDKVYIGFTAKNTGNVTWTNTGSNPVMVGTVGPLERSSAFSPGSGWLSGSRPALMEEASVAPGGTGTFEFWMTAPTFVGSAREYNERFGLVANGASWFNDTGLSYYIKVTPYTYSWQMVSQYAYTDSNKTTVANMNDVLPGQKIYVGFQAKNTGTATWTNTGSNPVMVGTANPFDRFSNFSPGSGWLSGSRPALMKEASVAPGGTGTFEFWMTAPTRTAVYNERFDLISNNLSWFNDTGLSFYVLVGFDPSGGDNLGANQALNANQYITSPDGHYRLIMQSDGNLVLYSINHVLWASGTAGKPVTKVIMQSDGNLVIYDSQSKPYWSSGTGGKGLSNLILQSDGNLVIYNGSKPIWSTSTSGKI